LTCAVSHLDPTINSHYKDPPGEAIARRRSHRSTHSSEARNTAWTCLSVNVPSLPPVTRPHEVTHTMYSCFLSPGGDRRGRFRRRCRSNHAPLLPDHLCCPARLRPSREEASRPSYVTSWDRSRSTVGIPSVPVIGPAPLKQLEVEVGGGRARGGDADGVLATACILDRGTGTGLEEGSWIVMSACFECGTHTQQPIGGYFTTGQASGRRLNKRKAIDRWCGRDFRLKRNGLGPSERVPRRPRTRRFSRPF
jgi:hypothetical protein